MKSLWLIILFFVQINAFSQYGLDISIIPYDYNYQISGMINNSEIEMRYQLRNDLISGYYFYNKYNMGINILGFKRNDTVTIFEFDANINKTGRFIGKINSDSTISGVWTNLNNGKKFPFKLAGKSKPFEDYTGYLSVTKEYSQKLYVLDTLVGIPYYIKTLDWTIKRDTIYYLFRVEGYAGSV